MRLFITLRRYAPKKRIAAAIVFGTISGGLSTGLLILINQYLFQWGESFRSQALWAFVVMLPMVALSRYVSAVTLAALGYQTSFDLQIQLTRRILAAPLRRLEEQGPHRLLVALTEDIGSLTDVLAAIPSFFINLAVVAGSLIYLAWLSWKVALVVLFFMVFGVITYSLPLRAGVRRQRLSRDVEDDLFQHFRGVTQGTKELKLRSRRRQSFLEHLKEAAGSYKDLRLSASRIFIGTTVWGNSLVFILLGLLLFYLPTVFEGLDTGVLGSYLVVLLYIMTPLQIILNDFPMLTRADVSLRKIERLGISLSQELPDEHEPPAPALDGDWNLELRDVSHTYHHEQKDDEFTLGPLDLTFRPGELVFLVGGNGSGKTTLAKVILGLYAPETGELRFAGEPVTEERLEEYREKFAAVFSDFFLFETLLGLESPDLDDRARAFLEQLQLHNKVRVQNGRLSTVDLSQGQRKRLALMTTLLDDRPIYLFDEWAADQDPDFKRVFYHQILPALRDRGKLVLVISHDDRYYGVGERVIKLDYGQVVYDRPIAGTRYAAV